MIKARSFILLFLLAGAKAFALPAVLRDVRPQDEERLKKELPSLFTAAGPDLPTLDEAIRVLMAQGGYENVFVESKNGHYEITGKPLRLVEEILFNGVNEADTDELRALLEIKPGDRFDRKKAVTSAEKIKNYYGEQGFFNAIVEINFTKLESKNIRLNIDIKEGPPCRIKGLIFETANTDLKARLDSKFRWALNKPLTTPRARRLINDLESYLIEQRYLAAEVSPPEVKYNDARTEAYMQFEVREPMRWEFYFSGYKWPVTATEIYGALDLRNKERKNVDPAGEGAERIRRFYLQRGFANVSIESKVIAPKDTYLRRVYYTINENARVKIKAVEVQGRVSRNSRYYENFIRKNSSDMVSAGWYNRQDLENGFKNLQTELRNQGFLRARVLSSRIEYTEKKDEVTVFLLLEEGPQTQIRGLDFEGNRFFSSFELAQVTGLETNSPLRLNEFESSIEKLKTFYRNQGFLEMKLLNENEDLIQYNDKGTQAKVLFRIYEGPRIRVNNIVVEGNSFTKSRVILKEADFRIGEVLTPQKLDDAIQRLNRMGLFSRVDVRTLEENSNVASRTLVITVAERDPGVFRFGGGINNERDLTIRGFTGLSYDNLWGTARAISGRVELKSNIAGANYPEHEVTAGYLEPFIFNTRTRGRVNLTRSERIVRYTKNDKVTPITTVNRVDFNLERDLTPHTRLNWKLWSLELRKERELKGRCTDGPVPAGADLTECSLLQIATIGPTLDIDYSDNRFLPTRGSFTRFTLDYSHPDLGSTDGVEFFRAEGNYTKYTRLGSPRWVWTNSLRAGYLRNLSNEPESGVPTSYAFLLGGIYTVRGFDAYSENERIPKDQTLDDGSRFEVRRGNYKLIQTNSHYYLVKTELRFPIYEAHGGVLFYDGAAVFISGYDFDRPYRDAVGIGYRYNTPVGPVAADIAFKLNPERDNPPREKIFRFHLSIGTF